VGFGGKSLLGEFGGEGRGEKRVALSRVTLVSAMGREKRGGRHNGKGGLR